MTFLSYSQNFEDVLLWRALGRIQNGFYIDVGANDPVLHSVTKAFYDAGWHGINVEPMPSYRQPFLDQRPRDINLNCAAGAEPGEITLFDVPTMNGWASTDAEVAVAHKEEGYDVVETRVPMRTLADICAEYVQGDIHFLKIDVEGFEGEVLKGMDLQKWRPWILVIEATLPGSRETNHDSWEHLVTPHGYRFAYFDGLNRYYVAQEHPELMAELTIQPNVFDAFIPHHLDQAWKEIREQSAQIAQHWKRIDELDAAYHEELTKVALTQAKLAQTQSDLMQADEWGRNLEQRLNAVFASTSWRITAPMRFIMRKGENSPANIARRKAKGAMRRSLRWATSREWLRRALLPLITRSPFLQKKVAAFLTAAKSATSDAAPHAPDVPSQLRELPQSARSALADLRRAYQNTAKH